MTSDTERRRAPRTLVEMPVTLALGDIADEVNVAAIVEDVSLSGVRCVTSHAIGVMTQVGLTLVLPPDPAGDTSLGQTTIACRGAVVRSLVLADSNDADAAAGAGDGGVRYATAIFFTNMAESDRVALQEFLQTV